MTNVIENEFWGIADWAADLLSIDRDVCRRAFHQEPEESVRKVLWWVLAERDLPGHDPERMIEDWAREYGAGVYRENRRRGSLEPGEGMIARTVLGQDPAA